MSDVARQFRIPSLKDIGDPTLPTRPYPNPSPESRPSPSTIPLFGPYGRVPNPFAGRQKKDLGSFVASAYGPPWGGIQGNGVTATGVDLRNGPTKYGVAVDPSVIKLGSDLYITPNPFGYSGTFKAFDTGGAIKGRRIDFYDWRGRAAQNKWGMRSVDVQLASGADLRDTPGAVGAVTGAVEDATGAVLGPVEKLAKAVGDIVTFLFGPNARGNWIRIGKVVLGIIALILAATVLGRSLVTDTIKKALR